MRTADVERALGAASLAALREHGLLLPAGEDNQPLPPAGEDNQPLLPPGEEKQSTELLTSPVQVYPVATGTYPEPARRDAAAESAVADQVRFRARVRVGVGVRVMGLGFVRMSHP